MNIGIIGSGNVGGTLGTRWARNGHRVVFASREPQSEKMRKLLAEAGPGARAGSSAEAADASEALLIATPWPATETAVRVAGDLSGKIVIDATNPLLPDLSGMAVGSTDSGGELVSQWAAGARVVKAFNTVGANIMADPSFKAKVALFYCGDDPEAKKKVAGLINELGFEALDAGPLTQCRVLEPFALLWISLAVKYGYSREIGFELLRR